MDRETAARVWGEQLADETAQAARVAYCRTAAAGVGVIGDVLYVGGHLQSDANVSGLSLAARMGGALARGECDLLDAGNAYAAHALARQLVEVEYLLFCFADAPDDAGRWLNASRSQLEKRFRPAQMRARAGGRFRLREYQLHCDRGGHPSPLGRDLVAARPPLDVVRGGWVDLGQHLERGWGLLLAAVEAVGWAGGMPDLTAVARARDAWHQRDAMAPMLTSMPPTD